MDYKSYLMSDMVWEIYDRTTNMSRSIEELALDNYPLFFSEVPKIAEQKNRKYLYSGFKEIRDLLNNLQSSSLDISQNKCSHSDCSKNANYLDFYLGDDFIPIIRKDNLRFYCDSHSLEDMDVNVEKNDHEKLKLGFDSILEVAKKSLKIPYWTDLRDILLDYSGFDSTQRVHQENAREFLKELKWKYLGKPQELF